MVEREGARLSGAGFPDGVFQTLLVGSSDNPALQRIFPAAYHRPEDADALAFPSPCPPPPRRARPARPPAGPTW